MSGIGHYTRLAAALFVAAVMGAAIANPDIGRKTAERSALSKIERLSAEERACAPGEAPLTTGFAPIGEVASVTPLGALAAPGEAPPTPYLRLNARRYNGRAVAMTAEAPAKGEVVAIERRIGAEGADLWTVRFKPCDRITVFYDGIETLDPVLLRRAGGPAALETIGEGRSAVALRLKLDAGDPIGTARAFDVGLIDLGAPAAQHADASHARTPLATGPSPNLSVALARALTLDESRARCALDYLPSEAREVWSDKFGDGAGRRIGKRADNACLADVLGSASAAGGVWFTDSSHNARARKVSAVALYGDLVDPNRLVFSLHGRMPSLIGADEAAPALSVVTAIAGDGRLNAPFEAIGVNETYCYEGLSAGLGGPAFDGVLVLRLDAAEGAPGLLKMEARRDAGTCADLPEPWGFTGNETSFYR